ncbi:Histidine--tRNA ligase mitochondrial [Ceratocystis platani]|uniref:Histidine--tRNA ligase, mitochondrial n=1 Tax=Ceratocystis fimbriata f. sp. platani TaxID=88771 RepID=A0A0F8B5E4_CERFI|nr:Histidine--tRNA ligase mitochondrial [Ceratocystis platani]
MGAKQKFELKTPKGTRDWFGTDITIRDHIFQTITSVFKKHGGVTLDQPVFELKEILTGKYGEDSKLIYDLKDQGGELCSLRYDLTVPFARFLAMNKDIQNIKRYNLSKVYRRDQPAVTKGRMREFYQCDFDIAGTYDPMLPDSEIIRIITEVFNGLGWTGNYTIKLNHRKILDGIFEVCGVPTEKIRTISSAVDKLDKAPWADVRKEMVEEKGLAEEVADKIGEWVVLKGKQDLLQKLRDTPELAANASMKAGMDDLELLFMYLDAFKCLEPVSFDLSLARGLDYYTGLIFEVVTKESRPEEPTAGEAPARDETKKSKKPKKPLSEDDDRSSDPSVGVGSVAAGGRYDELVGMFSPKSKIPCVGISFGIDRIFSITKARLAAENREVRKTEVDVFVMALGSGLIKERMQVLATLWDAGINAETLWKTKPRLPNQFKAAESNGVPFACILGEDEMAKGQVNPRLTNYLFVFFRVKEMGLRDGHPEKEGVLVSLANLAQEVKARIQRKKDLDDITRQAEGLRVVHGIKGAAPLAATDAAAPVEDETAVSDGAVAAMKEEQAPAAAVEPENKE